MKRIILVLIFALLLWPCLCYAYKVGNIEFQDVVSRGPNTLPLRGAGLKKFLTIRVVSVGLYLPKEIDSKNALTDIPKTLEVVYLQNIPNVELEHATTRGIRLNVTDDEFKRLEKRIEQMNSYYPSVRKMDRIRVSYVPGTGTTVEVNGQIKGTIAGADFGRAFFSIWVGDRPVDPRMKKILLGKLKQRTEEIDE